MILPKNKNIKNPLSKEKRIKLFKSMSHSERQELILRKMKDKGIKVGSGVLNKKI